MLYGQIHTNASLIGACKCSSAVLDESLSEEVISSKSRQRTRRGEAAADPPAEAAEEAVQEPAGKAEDAALHGSPSDAAAASSPGKTGEPAQGQGRIFVHFKQ